jgi:hypothetical protein
MSSVFWETFAVHALKENGKDFLEDEESLWPPKSA